MQSTGFLRQMTKMHVNFYYSEYDNPPENASPEIIKTFDESFLTCLFLSEPLNDYFCRG